MMPFGLGTDHGQGRTHSGIGVDRFKIKIEFTRLDLGQIQQIIDQRQQMLSRLVNITQIVPIPLVTNGPEAFFDHHFGKAHNRGERRAQFVADTRQRVGFLRIGKFGLPP